MAQYALIAVAPWINDDPFCSEAYMNIVQEDSTRGLIFFPTQPGASILAPVWQNQDWNTRYPQWVDWVRGKDYPIWAIDPAIGATLVQNMALYSGNVSQAPNATMLDDSYPPGNAIRLLGRVALSNSREANPVLGRLWVFAIMILGILCLVTGLTSLFMHVNQRRMRRDLRRRIAAGQVDLEVLGIKRQRVPQKLLDKMPLYVYTSKSAPPEDKTKERRQSTQAFTLAQRKTFPKRDVPFAQNTCAICLDDFEHNDTIVRELPCQHIFHPECVDDFLRTNSSLCPMCKKSALPAGYCPENITVSMVRRERLMRRMQNDAVGVPTISAILPTWSHRVLPNWILRAHIRPLQRDLERPGARAAAASTPAQAHTQPASQTTPPAVSSTSPHPASTSAPNGDLEMGTLSPPARAAEETQPQTATEPLSPPTATEPASPPTATEPAIPLPEDLPPEVQNLSPEERREWGRRRLAATITTPQNTDEEELDASGRRRGGIGRVWKRMFPS